MARTKKLSKAEPGTSGLSVKNRRPSTGKQNKRRLPSDESDRSEYGSSGDEENSTRKGMF